MRMPLLIGANPKVCSTCPTVRLVQGRWQLQFAGLTDSVFSLHIGNMLPILVPFNREFELVVPCDVSLSFSHRGGENSVSVYAQRIG